MRVSLTILATLAVLAAAAIAFPYTGLYDVSAIDGHSRFETWYLSTLSEHSIRARADADPPDLRDSSRVARGGLAYGQMCQTCHGGPGAPRSVTGLGLSPTPPDLAEAAQKWSSAEVYWILDEGIQMAGMPAFGPTHSEAELWEIVAFVEALPGMDSTRFAALTSPPDSSAVPAGHDGHDHVH